MDNKTFGTTLAELRKTHGMTQLELADKLGVTDKAVSKWERDLALPEVDNLIKISDMFGVSLDVLLRGEEFRTKTVETVEDQFIPQNTVRDNQFPPRKIVGTILTCFGAVVFLFLALFGEFFSALIFSSPFWLCGIICLIFKKRWGLLCSWAVYFSVYIYMGYATGMNLGSVFALTQIVLTKISGEIIQLVVTWAFVIVFILLSVWTVFSFRKETFPRKIVLAVLIVSASVFVITNLIGIGLSQYFIESKMLMEAYFLRYVYRILWTIKDFVENASVTVFFTSLVNLIFNRKMR